VADKRLFWVLSRQPKEISKFAKLPIPAHFKTYEEARDYCRQVNLRKGPFHPGYFIEERIGDKPVAAPKAKDEEEE
jgi:hypothetical protein